jgi:hypothetical protein
VSDESHDAPLGWAVLELRGRRRLAGWVSEQEIAGKGFVRIDIPATTVSSEESAADEKPSATQFYPPWAVYAITLCEEQTARAVAVMSRPAPDGWELPTPTAVDTEDPW